MRWFNFVERGWHLINWKEKYLSGKSLRFCKVQMHKSCFFFFFSRKSYQLFSKPNMCRNNNCSKYWIEQGESSRQNLGAYIVEWWGHLATYRQYDSAKCYIFHGYYNVSRFVPFTCLVLFLLSLRPDAWNLNYLKIGLRSELIINRNIINV